MLLPEERHRGFADHQPQLQRVRQEGVRRARKMLAATCLPPGCRHLITL